MYQCTACGQTYTKWQGKCNACGEWSTLEETKETPVWSGKKGGVKGTKQDGTVLQSGKENLASERILFASAELNTVLGGWLTKGSFTLLSGEPGIGKSTLSLQLVHQYAQQWREALYVSGEETAEQLWMRARRLWIVNTNVTIVESSQLEDILETVSQSRADFIVIDSISVLSSYAVNGYAWSVTQIRYAAEAFLDFAKQNGKSVVLIGHVTKDGSISGPKMLEHLVDTVLFLEGSRYEDYRILRSLKNRFGPTDEIGLFRMNEKGLEDITQPWLEFISKETKESAGSALAVTMEGSRPIILEIEALTTYTKFGYPKRSARGMPAGKLDLLIAVLSKFTDVKLENYDVYANVSRWLTINEPWIDLAILAAIVSSRKNIRLSGAIFLGEVSLTGIVRNVFSLKKRVDEAIKLGFTKIYIPKSADIKPSKNQNIHIESVGNVSELIRKLSAGTNPTEEEMEE